MSSIFASLRYLPLQLGMLYLGLTLMLFFFGPFDWPMSNGGVLLGFLLVTLLALSLGYTLSGYTQAPGRPLVNWRKCYRLGALASIMLAFPSTYAYTGKWPWDVLSVLGDQGAAYQEMLKALEANESGIRTYVALARGLFAPFVCCVIPFAILNWKSLRLLDILLLFGHIGAILVFSLMRGTDRETGDLLVFFGGSFMILVGQACIRHRRFPFSAGKVFAATLLLMLLLISTFALFLERKEARMGGNNVFCIAGGVVCSQRAPSDTPLSSKMDFALEMLTGYMAQGYYGLSLALKEDFTSTLGLGHSSFLMSNYSKVVDDALYQRSYLHKVDEAGWSDTAQWSTLFTWIASDVGFPLVPLVILVMGYLWGSAWKSTLLNGSEAGALVFLFLTLSVLYMPANNQLTQTLDAYFAFVFWLVVWLKQRSTRSTVVEV
ncbi:MAG: hypothetical protein ACN6PW_06675 [Pseudomonas kermanshahensis]|uniref:hypothetical protein n=1 Tax=Pseudomonas kermanshahensis TaxID=2745482 RepID=UPI0020924E83|nr:hypothetical protein [Pseudomonas kermanshahensis]USS57306.1 hypothetical protein NG836_10550 [Pseudomonas kermanshahensis]